MGTQKLAQLLKEEYGAESLIIESETVRSPNKIQKFKAQLSEFTQQEKNPILI